MGLMFATVIGFMVCLGITAYVHNAFSFFGYDFRRFYNN